MNRSDEEIRGAVNDSFIQAGIDARNLAIEVAGGRMTITGTVPDEMQRARAQALATSLRPAMSELTCRLGVLPVPPPDSANGRGRSPVTGTSADSAHESRHQLDD
jgi:hypothetical protein